MTAKQLLSAFALLVLASCDRGSRARVASAATSADTIVPPSPPAPLLPANGRDFGVAPVYTTRGVASAPVTSGERFSPPEVSSGSDSVIVDVDPGVGIEPISDSTAFNCTPKSLGPRDTLAFVMKTPHGEHLSLRAPGNTSYALVHPSYPNRTNFSIAPAESSKNLDTLKVPASLRLPPEFYGRDTIPEPVFSQPGSYVVFMSVNGPSDYGSPFTCTVTFTP